MMNQRTEDEVLAETETANDGAGPDPVATFEGPALAAILAALRDRNDAQPGSMLRWLKRAVRARPGQPSVPCSE